MNRTVLILIGVFIASAIPVLAMQPINFLIELNKITLNKTDLNDTGYYNISVADSNLLDGYDSAYFCPLNATACGTGGNVSWNESYADGKYYPLGSNPSGFYNTTTLPFYNNISNISEYFAFNVSWNNLVDVPLIVNGTAGANGLNGTNGTNGANGLNGTNGTNGSNGLNGTNGLNATQLNISTITNTGTTVLQSVNNATGVWGSVYIQNGTINTTDEIFAVCDNNTFLKSVPTITLNKVNISDLGFVSNANVSSITNTGTTLLQSVSNATGVWSSVYMQNGTINTTAQMFAAANNGTFALITEPFWAANYTAFNESWSTTFNASYDALIGSANDNASWNQTYADTLYAAFGSGGNVSWNETYADSKYYPFNNPSGFYNVTTMPFYNNVTGNTTDEIFAVCNNNTFLKTWTPNTTEEMFAAANNGTFALITEPYWAANYTAFNTTWATDLWNTTAEVVAAIPFYNNLSNSTLLTFNATYNTWAYNQTTPAINFTKTNSMGFYNASTVLNNLSNSTLLTFNASYNTWLTNYSAYKPFTSYWNNTNALMRNGNISNAAINNTQLMNDIINNTMVKNGVINSSQVASTFALSIANITFNVNYNTSVYNKTQQVSAAGVPTCSKRYNSTGQIHWCDCYNDTVSWVAITPSGAC